MNHTLLNCRTWNTVTHLWSFVLLGVSVPPTPHPTLFSLSLCISFLLEMMNHTLLNCRTWNTITHLWTFVFSVYQFPPPLPPPPSFSLFLSVSVFPPLPLLCVCIRSNFVSTQTVLQVFSDVPGNNHFRNPPAFREQP